ncbi:MAG: hypothetical protein ABJC74_03695 [Gemmatimonadota bacterium]
MLTETAAIPALPDPLPRARRPLHQYGASAVGLIGAVVMLGWLLNLGPLKQVVPGMTAMTFNTALGFLAAGGALHCLPAAGHAGRSRLADSLAVVIILIGGMTLWEYVSGRDLGIDQLLVPAASAATLTALSARMAMASTVCFILVGAALLTSRPPPAPGRWPRLLSLVVLFVAALALVGYAYEISPLYSLTPQTAMALPTAVAFLILGLALVGNNLHDGALQFLANRSPGGASARRLLLAITGALFVLGWLALAGQRAGLYDESFGLALLVSAIIIVASTLVAWQASRLHQSDLILRAKDHRLQLLNSGLEQMVEERTSKLQATLAEVKRLDGLLPICAWCKRIRDDQDYWHSVEGYISSHSRTRFTQAICPRCQAEVAREDLAASLTAPV